MYIRPIKTESDYHSALERLEAIFDAEANTPEGDEAEVLDILIDEYEKQNYPIDPPDPIEAIRIRMQEKKIKQVDLVPMIGGKSRVSEVLNRKRKLTLGMIRRLSSHLNLPPDLLIQDYPLSTASRPSCSQSR